MSDAPGGSGRDREDEPTLVDHPTSASGVRARWTRRSAGEKEEVQHSALVGFMSVPVHRRFPIRRSTLVLVVAFLGLGTLLYFNPPQSEATGKGAVVGGYFVPGAVAVSTTTTTPPTTTTVPPTTTTTTTRGPAVTTTTGPVFPATTPTSTARGATTTTVPAPVGGGAGGAAGSTTTTTGAQLGATGNTGPTTTAP
jgi:hypothetical protein